MLAFRLDNVATNAETTAEYLVFDSWTGVVALSVMTTGGSPVRTRMTPTEARKLATALLQAADDVEVTLQSCRPPMMSK
jgi:hypothetical protein